MFDNIKNKIREKREGNEVLYDRLKKGIPVFLITIIFLLTINHILKPIEVTYNEFIELADSGKVEFVHIGNKDKFNFVDIDGQKYVTSNPMQPEFREYLLKNNIEVSTDKSLTYMLLFFELFKLSISIMFFILIIKKVGLGALEKQDNMLSDVPTTTFKSIAGNDEAKADMEFLVKFLKNPKDYVNIGAKLPKGIVLYGPPGTGKTLTARAIAGEAQVPFFSVSGSDFIELYAGLGAKRVRELYEEARENAPCIVFIDEIDAIGTHRTSSINDSEKNQTINALLAELDGFDNSSPIITIVATNRVEDLDKALIRPGRFDRHIAIALPDEIDRLAILNVYAKNKKINETVNLEDFAKLTVGFSGAALETLMNEAAILAVNEGYDEITEESLHDAYFKIIVGGHKKKNRKRDPEEVKLIAYHEAGHALTSKLLTDNSTPAVTIIPSTTGTGGITFNIPKKTGLMSKGDLLNTIKVLYGGRAAEFVLTNNELDVTTGASNDIQMASEYIRSYYEDYGMSEFGLLTVNEEEYRDSARRLAESLFDETVQLLKDNNDTLDRIAKALINKETIMENELDSLIY